MDIPEIFAHFEKPNVFSNAELCSTLLQQLNKSVNDKSSYNILQSTSRYKRIFFAIGANENTLAACASNNVIDPHFKTLFAHSFLCRLSGKKDVSTSEIESIIQIIINNNAQEPGTTLGMAIGYTLGKLLHNGNNVNSFLKICSPKYVLDYKIFLKGFRAACSNTTPSLMQNSSYAFNLKERYDDWQTESFNICKKVLLLASDKTNYDVAQINPLNERITGFLQAFFPRDQFIADIHSQHVRKLNILNSNTIKSPDVAAAVETLVVERANKLVIDIENNYNKKLAKETAKLSENLDNERMRLTQTIEGYEAKLASEIARIEKKAIDNAHIILAEQAAIKEAKETQERNVAFKSKINKML